MKSENIVRSEFNNLCKQLGITGNTNNIKKELCERIVDLPDIYDEIVKKTMNLEKVVEFYTAFVELTLGRAHDGGCVPMIQYINGKNWFFFSTQHNLSFNKIRKSQTKFSISS